MRKISVITVIVSTFLLAGCKENMDKLSERVMKVAKVQLEQMDARVAVDSMPKTFIEGKAVDSGIKWWCSGFFPGSLWYVYEATGDENIKALAIKNTLKLANIMDYPTHHDIGFQVNCSYGNAYRLTGDEAYLPLMEASAKRLASRFSPIVGCIRSWDKEGDYIYPVIIDNMMNLEHLLNCDELFDYPIFTAVAREHAKTTIKNHFRADNSCWHLVDYNPQTGEVDHKQTVQGYCDDSAWSRGQAWALYGYTMMYERTGDEIFLEQAEKVASYIIPMLCKDGIPYWDFNAPGTEHAMNASFKGAPENYVYEEGDAVKRDASAGAIMASAFVTLSRLTPDKSLSREYRAIAEKQIRTLASKEYLASPGENGGFLLKHSVGNLHHGTEVDVPLTYADYYFLEAIVKYTNLKK